MRIAGQSSLDRCGGEAPKLSAVCADDARHDAPWPSRRVESGLARIYVIGLVIGAPPICAWVVRGPASRHRAACESCALRAAQLSIDYESLSPLAVWPGRRRRRCTRRAPARPRRARSGAPPGKFMRMPDFLIVATQSRLWLAWASPGVGLECSYSSRGIEPRARTLRGAPPTHTWPGSGLGLGSESGCS